MDRILQATLLLSLFGIAFFFTGNLVYAVEADFDIEIPAGFSGPLLLKDRRLLAVERIGISELFSSDGGRTWSDTKDSGLWCGASSPPDLKLLADGHVLLTRGYRREPFGVRCHISEDEGDTWTQQVVLRDDGPDRDVGYPSTVQFDDGQLLTVYYWHGEDGIRHLQRTSWELEG